VQLRFLLGAAGSGKTYQCLGEARQALLASPEGLPMVLLAPKQGTYQLEQQLLSGPELCGYTRLSILSFESLAHFILDRLGKPRPTLLTEEGRVMVLRSLLASHRSRLKVFRASARLTGFAQELSRVLQEMQQAGLDAATLAQAAAGTVQAEGLKRKLEDLSVLLRAYQDWLDAHSLQDYETLLRSVAGFLRTDGAPAFRLQSIWVDGFAEFSDPELDLLAGLFPCCDRGIITFCLDRPPVPKTSWLSHWSLTERTLKKCKARFASLPGSDVRLELLPCKPSGGRFIKSAALSHLQQSWETPQAFREKSVGPTAVGDTIKLRVCPDPEAEVTAAAREILKFVRAGGRYREVAVLVRNLDPYHYLFQRVFRRYEIPFFLDQRESVSHHPLAELTRSALRVVAFDWKHEDWFAALKTGLVPAPDTEMDLLENEALARGWNGKIWLRPLELKEVPKSRDDAERLARLSVRLEQLRRAIVPPFERLALALVAVGNRPTGPQMAQALHAFWENLNVQEQLQRWSAAQVEDDGVGRASSIHETVWRQIEAWLENAALAFANDSLSLREWLPILEAGLATLTVGIIPPALDQVLIGAVDRSRTPDVKLSLVLGLNEGVFPGRPDPGRLLSEADRVELEKCHLQVGPGIRQHLGRERYLGYIACTRARERLVLSWAASDAGGTPLNSSSLISHVRQLFPDIETEVTPALPEWADVQHPVDWMEWGLRSRAAGVVPALEVPKTSGLEHWSAHVHASDSDQSKASLGSGLAGRLYGSVLRTSVSRIEQFAACPFKFFIHSGLRAEERKLFELDSKEQGTFQHDVLALFHQSLRSEGKRWRDITPAEARDRVGQIAAGLLTGFRQGLLQASDQARFTASVLTESLQDFIEVLVNWMREQYLFDPIEVELPFGVEEGTPAWNLELSNGKRLEVYGRIDRVDLYREPAGSRALCVVVDYKSSQKQLDPLMMQNGLQLQLLTYLGVLRQWPNPKARFGVEALEPAGVFYVNLRGRYAAERNRVDALAEPEQSRRLAYRHFGRYNLGALPYLDSRRNLRQGDQVSFRFNNDGRLHAGSREALTPERFQALLNESEAILREMAQRVFSGAVGVSPYRKGQVTACDQCTYQAVCRIDPWTHPFRNLSLRNVRSGSAGTDSVEGAAL
jgi:ATP-dependent helicase/nuclease subunit B